MGGAGGGSAGAAGFPGLKDPEVRPLVTTSVTVWPAMKEITIAAKNSRSCSATSGAMPVQGMETRTISSMPPRPARPAFRGEGEVGRAGVGHALHGSGQGSSSQPPLAPPGPNRSGNAAVVSGRGGVLDSLPKYGRQR